MPNPTVNPQIIDAVELTNRVVLESSRQATTAIAFQEVAQSMALAVQSGVEHLQSIFTLNVATTGSALARLLEDAGKEGEVRASLEQSQKAVGAAMEELAQLAATAANALSNFPKDSGAAPGPARSGQPSMALAEPASAGKAAAKKGK